jgi:hypothetical protein
VINRDIDFLDEAGYCLTIVSMLEMEWVMSNSVEISSLSSLTDAEAESLMGQTLRRVVAGEYSLVLTFSNGLMLSVSGHQYSDCALGVDVERIPVCAKG